jgi:tetratricopeptide (TPR) repeat protein
VHESAGQIEECIAYRRRAIAAAERLGDPHLIAGMVSNLGGALYFVGRFDDARQAFLRALAILRSAGDSWYLAYPTGGLAGIALKYGELEEAERYAEESLAAAERTGDPERIYNAHNLLAQIERRRGNPVAARDRLVPLIERLGRESAHLGSVLPSLSGAHAEIGELDQAEEVADRAVTLLTRTNDRISLVHALQARARIRMAQGRWDDARAVLGEAADLARQINYPVGADEVREDLARLRESRADAEGTA